MWTFQQSTGWLSREAARWLGYAGNGIGKNNPSMQSVKNTGPLPCGFYTFAEPANDPEVGEFAMRLIPDPSNDMFGRGDFFLHGDDRKNPGNASKGCIVAALAARKDVDGSGDRRLQVIP